MQPQTTHRGVLSIAGYDPSGGGGILADTKTFEQIGSYGCGIITAVTYQNDIECNGVKWLPLQEINKQFDALKSRFDFQFAKIGLVQDANMLKDCIEMLKNYNPGIKIIWDPVMKASAGFEFGNVFSFNDIKPLLKDIYLVTPNINEMQRIFPAPNAEEAAAEVSMYSNVLLKGGHKEGNQAVDILFHKRRTTGFVSDKIMGTDKRGTGCVLSAAITAYLDSGEPLEDACNKAKKYTLNYIKSAERLLGFHANHINILA